MQKLLALLIICAMVAFSLYSTEVAQMLGVSLIATRWLIGITTVIVVVAVPLLIPNPLLARLENEGNRSAPGEAEYSRFGLGPVPLSETARECYLDLLQRALTNVLYEDLSLMGYDKSRTARLTD